MDRARAFVPSVTTAPGIPPFEASTTVPAIDPTDWAKTGADVSTATTRINVDTRKHGSLISHLPVMARFAQRGDLAIREDVRYP
jgi:hypothetical protein